MTAVVEPAPETVPIVRPLEWPPPKAPISSIPYLPGLDGMRGLAVAAVMVYHANNAWLPGGFLGVEVFFVISGYLITLLLIGEHERSGSVNLGQFWLRRARRLLPALFVLLIGVTVYTALFRRDALGQLRGDVIASLTYVTNWYQIWVGQGYTAAGDFAPLRHLWSLAVEEQFYLLWPLVMVGLMRLGRKRLPTLSLYLLGAAIGVSVLMGVLFYGGPAGTCEITPGAYWQLGERCISKTDTLYLGTITRAGGLLLGGAFAMVWRPMAIIRGPMRSKAPVLDACAVFGLAALGALCWSLFVVKPGGADAWLFRGGFFIAGLATLLLIAAVTHQKAKAGPVLGNVVLLWVGTRSYGLYLYHWPIYQAIRRVAGNPLTWPQFVLAVALACVVTELSYRFVETPIRKGAVGRWWKQLRASHDPVPRRLIATGAAAIAALTVFAGANLALAELRPNDVEQSINEGEAVVTDLGARIRSSTTEDGSGGTRTTDALTTTDAATTTEETSTTAEPTTTAPDTVATSTPVVVSAETSTTVAPATTTPATTTPAATTPAATTTPPTTPPVVAPPAPPIIAIGDSVMLGAAANLAERGIIVDAIESRQVESSIGLMEGLRDSGQLGGAVVIHLGTNGPPSAETLDGFFNALTGVPKVVVLTAHADRSWIAETNANLYALPQRFPNVTILDWAALAPQCPGDCFWDGIHVNPAGRRYYADLIAQALGI
ncbi:MAG: acyltransferase family protein [Ilumatobacteraceae bacterium]